MVLHGGFRLGGFSAGYPEMGWGWSHEDSGAICRRDALVSLHVDILLARRSSCLGLESKRTAWRTSSGVA